MNATADGDIVSAIVADHREVERTFTALEGDVRDPRQRRDLVDHVITELVRHSVGEEMYVYPAARQVLPDGDEVADHELSEHAEAERVMKELEQVPVDEPRFEQLLTKLIGDIRHHVQDEETDLLPRLRAACSAEDLRRLGEQFAEAKASAPTRPHPSAPDRPPANRILAPGAGLIDRVRDALSGRQT